jgi:hypothetical protein
MAIYFMRFWMAVSLGVLRGVCALTKTLLAKNLSREWTERRTEIQ